MTRVAIVTGAGSGIGLATAALLAERGWSVVGGDLDPSGLAALPEVHGVAMDVRDPEDAQALVAATLSRHGRLDAVAAIAGVERGRPVDQLDPEDWDLVVDTSLKGTFLTCRAAIPALRRSGGGAIATMGSVLGRASLPATGAYGAAKAGIEGLTRAIAIDHAADSIRCNCVIAGATDTPLMWQRVAAEELDDVRREAAREVPLGFVAGPRMIAEVIAFLLSDGAAFMTGASVVADGGVLARFAADH